MEQINKFEESLLNRTMLFVIVFTVFVCSSLYYLPGIQARLDNYIAKQESIRFQREQRQEMLAKLSGLEFLDYSTRQAMSSVAQLPEDEQEKAAAELEFEQQLRLEIPKGASKDTIAIDNHYVTQTIEFKLPDTDENYLARYPMIGKSDHIERLDYITSKDGGILELKMDGVYELDLDWEEKYLFIDFLTPQEVYDKVIVIDAGHGAGMPGAIIDGVQEKDIDLAIVQQLKKIFDSKKDEKLGVYYTRLDDSDPDFSDRSGLANLSNANLFVSIHSNSFVQDASIHGTGVLYDEKKDAAGNSSKHLAEILLKNITETLGTKNRGLIPGNNIYIVRTSEVPAALVEVGFMTNKKELANLTNENYQKKCAEAIYLGIMQALEEGY